MSSMLSSNKPSDHQSLIFSRFNKSVISELFQNLERVNSQIQITKRSQSLQLKKNESEANRKIKYDPMMMLAKLRDIENKSSVNRAQLEMLTQRKPKRYSQRQKKPQSEDFSYKKLYSSFQLELQEQQNQYDFEQNSDEESSEYIGDPPSGIKYFNLLKKNPKLLQYTLIKLENKDEQKIVIQKKEGEKNRIKNANLQSAGQYKNQLQQWKNSPAQIDCEAIADDQMTKFYSKGSKCRLDKKVLANNRCTRLMSMQRRLICSLEQEGLSKQNLKRLKQKLNQVVNDLNKNQKQTLPKLTQRQIKF